MVSSQIPCTTKSYMPKSFRNDFILPLSSPDVSSEQVELDFSDVFGPQPLNEPSDGISEGVNISELIYDDPEVISNELHSLVGPTSFKSQSLKPGQLTLHEAEVSVELTESLIGEAIKEDQTIGLKDFEVMKLVGQGAFGKVFQVKKKGTSEIYAMKVMRKDKIMEKNHAEYMKAERDILTRIDHPFIVQLRYSFQTKYRLYLVLDFINGGHLFFQLYHQGLFSEDLARIYTAEIVSAVSHLHENGIMHRDLKPENILLDADGHAMLTDFGLAKEFEADKRSNSMCGTVQYMSPEIILGKGHDKAADWWSVGILLFEMLTGKPPFIGNREKIQQNIVKGKIKLPTYLSSEAHSLLKGLLQKEPSKRIGSGPNGSDEIKKHKWFKRINWRRLEAREVQPSFRPEVAGKQCIANFDKCWTEMPLQDSPVSSPNCDLFQGFTYVRPSASLLHRAGTPLC